MSDLKIPENAAERLGTEPAVGPFRERLWRIIFLSDTAAGRGFDIGLLWIIAASVLVVMLESVDSLRARNAIAFRAAEWAFTIVFTIEYVLRLWVVRQPWRYARSFFGVVDLLAFLPTYLELVFAGSHYLMILRVLRMLRMFRILKMAHHIGEAGVLVNALLASRAKISLFLFTVMALVCVEGTLVSPGTLRQSRLPQHPAGHLLGHRHDHDGGLWRRGTRDRPGENARLSNHAYRLRHPRCSHRGGDGRTGTRNGAQPRRSSPLSRMRLGSARLPCPLLPSMRGPNAGLMHCGSAFSTQPQQRI